MHLVLNLIAIDFFLSSLSLLFPLLRLLDGYGASVRSRWLVETGEGAHTGPWVPVQGEIDRPTATGIPLTGRQQEQVWNQPPDRQRTLSDGNYVYGWYGQILLDTPISEIYTGCWPVTNPNLSIIKIDSTISIITIYYDLSKFERETRRYGIRSSDERRKETISLLLIDRNDRGSTRLLSAYRDFETTKRNYELRVKRAREEGCVCPSFF